MRITPLDKLFSEFIRRRAMARVHGCERCLTGKVDYKELQCSHFWGRKRQLVRYDEDNSAGLCGACHLYLSANPSEHTTWFKNHLGEEAFDLLEARASKVGRPDEAGIALYLKEKIRELRTKGVDVGD